LAARRGPIPQTRDFSLRIPVWWNPDRTVLRVETTEDKESSW
jgi:hypothetical protein